MKGRGGGTLVKQEMNHINIWFENQVNIETHINLFHLVVELTMYVPSTKQSLIYYHCYSSCFKCFDYLEISIYTKMKYDDLLIYTPSYS